jgi:hypothetical protein
MATDDATAAARNALPAAREARDVLVKFHTDRCDIADYRIEQALQAFARGVELLERLDTGHDPDLDAALTRLGAWLRESHDAATQEAETRSTDPLVSRKSVDRLQLGDMMWFGKDDEATIARVVTSGNDVHVWFVGGEDDEPDRYHRKASVLVKVDPVGTE